MLKKRTKLSIILMSVFVLFYTLTLMPAICDSMDNNGSEINTSDDDIVISDDESIDLSDDEPVSDDEPIDFSEDVPETNTPDSDNEPISDDEPIDLSEDAPETNAINSNEETTKVDAVEKEHKIGTNVTVTGAISYLEIENEEEIFTGVFNDSDQCYYLIEESGKGAEISEVQDANITIQGTIIKIVGGHPLISVTSFTVNK